MFSATGRADFSYQETVRHGRESAVSTSYIKGNRMAILQKNRITVIDLERETVTQVDLSKKTYSAIPFAQLKTTAEPIPNTSFKPTDRSSTIGVMPAREFVLEANEAGINCQVSTVPGYDEVRAFQRKTGEKLGYLQGLQEFGQFAWAINKLQGAPLLCTLKKASGETLSMEFTNLNAAPVPDSRFDVPGGFKKAQ